MTRLGMVKSLASAIVVAILIASAASLPGQILTPIDESNSVEVQSWRVANFVQSADKLKGAASCAATSCHGGPRASIAKPDAARGSEHSLWREMDPHARSWATISSEQSTQILQRLGILRDGQIVNMNAYANCLACHNTSIKMVGSTSMPTIAEGVGCESCHGASQDWYESHYVEQSVSAGMTDIKPWLQRARMCVSCHVGAADRDMNHDIIAAGHPALYFDFAVYHEMYPKHWRDAPELAEDQRAKLWLAGQIAMADAELELIETRSRKSHSVSMWPELALYTCVDCHQTLDGIPRSPTAADRDWIVDGRASVRLWNLSGVDALASYRRWPNESIVLQDLQSLKDRIRAGTNDPASIAVDATKLRQKIALSLYQPSTLNLEDWTRANQVAVSQAMSMTPGTANRWDSAAKFYIAAWSSRSSNTPWPLYPALQTLRRGLIFNQSSQSPTFPRSTDSVQPPNFEEWQEALRQAAIGLEETKTP